MIGVLLMNTGTPDAPTPEAIRPYLKEFLSDPNLIDMPAFVWKPILNLFILPNRPKKTAPRYAQFWTEDGSPFMLTSRAQRDGLQARLDAEMPGQVRVELSMNYGNPSTASGIEALLDAGVEKIIVVPLYPQFTKSCGGSCFQHFDEELDLQRSLTCGWAPLEVAKVSEYWNAPGYIDALAQSVRQAWPMVDDLAAGGAGDVAGDGARGNADAGAERAAAGGSGPEGAASVAVDTKRRAKLIVSFHSIPVSHIQAGDTYAETTAATKNKLAAALGLDADDVLLTYQCRFDNRKWLGPMLEPTLQQLAAEGYADVAVVCPGFAADCLETTLEVGDEFAQVFLDAARSAGEVDDPAFTYIPALGASEDFIDVLAGVVKEAL